LGSRCSISTSIMTSLPQYSQSATFDDVCRCKAQRLLDHHRTRYLAMAEREAATGGFVERRSMRTALADNEAINALMVEQDVLTTMGFERLAKSQISELCNELDAKAGDFRNRPLTDEYPYLWLDALYEKVHIGDSVVSNAFVIAYGVTVSGIRDVLAIDVVDTESKESWARFLQGLRRRARDGKLGTKLVISDAHEGLKAATAVVFRVRAGNAARSTSFEIFSLMCRNRESSTLRRASAMSSHKFPTTQRNARQRNFARNSRRARKGGSDLRQRTRRRACILTISARSSSQNCDHQSHRASQPRDPPTDPLDRNLSVTRVGAPNHHDDSRRATRRMDGRSKIYVARVARTRRANVTTRLLWPAELTHFSGRSPLSRSTQRRPSVNWCDC